MRRLLFCIVFLFPLLCYGQENGPGLNIKWGVQSSFDINMPGNWTSFSKSHINMSYGGSVGGLMNFSWPSAWYVESGVSLNFDDLKLSEDAEWSRFSMSLPIVAGHKFDVMDRLIIAPLAGCELSCGLADHRFKTHNDLPDGNYELNRFNVAWGIGFEIFRDNFAIGVMSYLGLLEMSKPKYRGSTYYDNKSKVSLKYYF